MASNTENLNLLMKNPSTDGADTFNVQTMLNENWQKIDNNAGTVAQTLANILKPTTPPIIGLPPSTTPDGMFQALGNTGELHVWRKTVVSSSEQPAGYTLGDVIENSEIWVENRYADAVFHYATSISVSDTGLVSLVGEKTATIGHSNNGENIAEFDVFKGKFVYISGGDNNKRQFIFYIPANATFHRDGNYSTNKIYADKEQRVNAHGIIPPGTTTTYPVSTNPKAYQEWDDAKAAGYVVGEVKSGKFRVSSSYANGSAYWNYGTSLTVSDDGTVNIANPSSVSLSGSSSSVASNAQQMAGKYAVCTSVSDTGYESDFPIGTVVFFPSDTLFTRLDSSCWASKYQPVTGYPAIPAGTTIEYLGKLGDKARVQVLSYVGTGTYGSSNPNSLTFDFVPKIVMLFAEKNSNGNYRPAPNSGGWADMFIWLAGMHGTKINGSDVYFTLDGKKLSWYAYSSGAYYQCNSSGSTYIAVAIG